MTREKIVNSMSLQDAIQVFKDTPCYGTMDIAKSVILKALEKEVRLDKIREDIEFKYRIVLKDTPNYDWAVVWNECIKEVLEIIDKYNAESEDNEE